MSGELISQLGRVVCSAACVLAIMAGCDGRSGDSSADKTNKPTVARSGAEVAGQGEGAPRSSAGNVNTYDAAPKAKPQQDPAHAPTQPEKSVCAHVKADTEVLLAALNDGCSSLLERGVIPGSVYTFASAARLMSQAPVDVRGWGWGFPSAKLKRELELDEKAPGLLYLMDVLALPGSKLKVMDDGRMCLFGPAEISVRVASAEIGAIVISRKQSLSPSVTFEIMRLRVQVSDKGAVLDENQLTDSWAIVIGDLPAPTAYTPLADGTWLPIGMSPAAALEISKIERIRKQATEESRATPLTESSGNSDADTYALLMNLQEQQLKQILLQASKRAD